MKIKSNSNTPVGTKNNKSALKIKTPNSVKSSPELHLGLKLEKLIEKGVNVKKVDHENSATPKKLKSLEKINEVKKIYSPKKGKVNALANKSDSSKVQNPGVSIEKNGQNAEVLPKRKRNRKRFKVVSSGVVSKKSKRKKIRNRFVKVNGVKCKKPKQNTNEVETLGETRVKLSKAKEAAERLLEHQADKAKKNGLLDEPEKVQIRISVIKKGHTAFHGIRCALPHPIISEDDDVCLFVKDKVRGDIERSKKYFKNFLKEKGIHRVKQIITCRQLLSEYNTHETRRKLSNSYDFFLTDSSLSEILYKKLGKPFLRTRKYPVNVDLKSQNLKTLIEKAISKVTMKISKNQDMVSCDVAHTGFSAEQISENVLAVVNAINKETFPGGWKNVRLVAVKPAYGPTFPIFLSTLSPNEITVPIVKRKKPKTAVPVTGELTTMNKPATVTVLPDDTVKVQFEEEDGDDDDDDDDDNNDNVAVPGSMSLIDKRSPRKQSQGSTGTNKKFKASKMETPRKQSQGSTGTNKKFKASKMETENDDEDNSDDNDKEGEESDDNDKEGEESDDDLIEEAEEQYLKGLMNESWATESDEESNKKTPKQKKESIMVKNKFGLAKLNKKPNNSVKQKKEDTDDDGWGTGSDESEETEDVATATPNSKKRKLPLENETSTSKKIKPAKNVLKKQITEVLKKKGTGTFDTRLGETWTGTLNPKEVYKRKNYVKKKLNKSQRKNKIKTRTQKNKR